MALPNILPQVTVNLPTHGLSPAGAISTTTTTLTTGEEFAWGLIATASGAASAYHGYKRHNGSVGAAVGWGVLGVLVPVITPAVALAQGFGKPMRRG